MRNSMLSLAATLALALSTSAFANAHKEAPGMASAAANPPAAKTAQQSKMATCNAEAADKKGDERKAFMKTCLSAPKVTAQQGKMKQCNVDAKDKKGDERKAFMKSCLSA